MKKSLFLLLALFASAFAQDRNISIGGSIGYVRSVLDELEDYPFEGFGFGFGASGFIPLTDAAKFGSGISIDYITASATVEDDVKLTISGFILDLSPRIRFGQDKKYADIGLGISIPLSEEQTWEIPGYGTQTQKVKDSETYFRLSLSGRVNVIGLAISKGLTGINKSVKLGASAFIPITEQAEIEPFINYSTGDTSDVLRLGIGFDYWL